MRTADTPACPPVTYVRTIMHLRGVGKMQDGDWGNRCSKDLQIELHLQVLGKLKGRD